VQENKQIKFKINKNLCENKILDLDRNNLTYKNEFVNLENLRDERINFMWREKIFPNFE